MFLVALPRSNRHFLPGLRENCTNTEERNEAINILDGNLYGLIYGWSEHFFDYSAAFHAYTSFDEKEQAVIQEVIKKTYTDKYELDNDISKGILGMPRKDIIKLLTHVKIHDLDWRLYNLATCLGIRETTAGKFSSCIIS